MATDTTATRRQRGRPKINIDIEQFEKLCALQCTESEIAGWFGCSIDTICNWCKKTYKGLTFAEVFEEKRERGKASLRSKQWRLAESSPAMAIFLGKQYLGQSDDPLRHAKEESQEDKLGRLLDAVTDAVVASTPTGQD